PSNNRINLMTFRPKYYLSILGLFASTIYTISPVQANDGGLYESIIDPNLSFIRVVMSNDETPTIAGKSLSDADGAISPYLATNPGDVAITLGSARGQISTESGNFYTVMLDEDGSTKVFEDEIGKSPAKASLFVYNLTSKPDLDLFVPKAKRNALSDIDEGVSKSVSIKAPLKLAFSVKFGDDVLAEVPQVSLKRGGSVAIVIMDNEQGVEAFVVDGAITK
ncbi:MAG: alginate O-acetyltransferase AlgF, partial [Lentilitoribacter sp.]